MEQPTNKPLLDFSDYIAEQTRDFTGRAWVFAEIERWLADPDAPRYFIITGEPGIGKTALAAQLVQHITLSASHFCMARQSRTLDPFAFVQALAHQLTTLPGFVEALADEHGIHPRGQVQADGSVYGEAPGGHIEQLVTKAASPLVAFNRVVVDPLKRRYANGFTQPVVVLVDALDEAVQFSTAETIIDLLANAHRMQTPLRFILTSRPDSGAIHLFEQLHLPYFILEANRQENLEDIRTYVYQQIGALHDLQKQVEKQRLSLNVLVERMVKASEGNFLYVIWLLRSIQAGTQQLDTLMSLPKGLDGIYQDYLRIRPLGREIANWEQKSRPVLGILAVAKAPLILEQMQQFTGMHKQALRDVLWHIHQFLDPALADHGQYQLYHQSITDFLTDQERAQEFWIDVREYHEYILKYYLSKLGLELTP